MKINEERFEQQKFSDTKAFIEAEIIRLASLRRESREKAIATGKKYAEDNPYGSLYMSDNFIEIQESVADLLDTHDRLEIDIYMLKKLINAPYFARIDFEKNGMSVSNTFYIGLKNLYDKENYKTLVSDWRAPVADLFYNEFDNNMAYYDAPISRIEGKILLKRQFKFEKGELKYFFNSDVKINDEILQEVLCETSQDKLKVIVSSIQREQNTAIRYKDSENLIVFGPAGSGKTSIGLHRAAYLLYKNRQSLSSKDIVLFTNSNVFASYLSDIIPELGEEDIVKTDFYSIIESNIDHCYSVADYYEQANALLSHRAAERKHEIELKYSDTFIKFLENYIANESYGFHDIKVYGEIVISKKLMLERFEMDINYTLTQRCERLKSFCISEIDSYFEQMRPVLISKIDEECEPYEDAKQIFRTLRRNTKRATVESIENSLLMDEIEIYLKALRAYCESTANEEIYHSARNRINTKNLKYEDALLVLYVKKIIGSLESTGVPKHVLIDEAQDFCPLQHIIIKSICTKSRFTLLADINQGILPETNTTSKAALIDIYNANAFELTKSYRSTTQINEAALKLLPGEEYDIFKRDGEDIEKIISNDHTAAIAELDASGKLKGKSTCIVTRTLREAVDLYEKLAEKIKGLKLIDERTDDFSDGIIIIPLVFTKGLEFDNVIIPYADKLCDKNTNPRILYLMVTRALHRLFVIFEDRPCFPFD